MERTEGYFTTSDATNFSFQSWKPENPVMTLVVTHGLAEHSDCYCDFAEAMAQKGIHVYAWDLRGHGRSEGRRGFISEFSTFCSDLKTFVNHIKEKDDKPLSLFGHSMGGLITLRWLIEQQPKGIQSVALSAPALGVSVPVPTYKTIAAKVLAKTLPQVTLSNEIDYKNLTRDRSAIERYEKDGLRHDKISSRLYLGMVDSIDYVMQNAEKLEIPALLQIAGHDVIVDSKKIESFYERISSHNKKKCIYEDSYHEIFNDLDREQAYTDLGSFLKGAMA